MRSFYFAVQNEWHYKQWNNGQYVYEELLGDSNGASETSGWLQFNPHKSGLGTGLAIWLQSLNIIFLRVMKDLESYWVSRPSYFTLNFV